ncbi:MAG TPA: hypothetical protein VGX68_06000 [Thermoanaerobaculia bacterium]|nr:hypothetical protein [Thermoanaerobaculia bacterium]
MTSGIQAEHLTGLGASPAEVEELLAYNENPFDLKALISEVRFPLADEPFVTFWEPLVAESCERGAFAVLREHLPQLRFPICEGISRTESYLSATRKGVPPEAFPEATGLELAHSGTIELAMYTSPAGRIPLLIARHRAEFVALIRALTRKNEPDPVADAQGALMVSGYNNWSRIRELRRGWEDLEPSLRGTATWAEELARIQQHRELYQDRFILLSDGPYSAVPAAELDLEDEVWREISLAIRRDHECTHYFTRRLFGSMRNNVLDELIADYIGLVGATGKFRADWFLRFIGLEEFPRYRPGGRLDIYRGKPQLSDGAFRVLHALVKAAAENLEQFDSGLPGGARTAQDKGLLISVLASLRLEDLAAAKAQDLLTETLAMLQRSLGISLS